VNGGGELRIDFWDVAQADCSVITLPNGRLIIIDVGRAGSPLVDWLNERRGAPPEIEAIVLTHNHADHAGALCSIVAEHKRRIGVVWMLADRDASDLRQSSTFRCAEQAQREHWFQIRRLEDGQTIWSDPGLAVVIRAVHPSFTENIAATSPNPTSGMVIFESRGVPLIAWPGDLDITRVADKCGGRSPWLLFGPHHGGPTDIMSKVAATTAIRQLSPRRAFISVGTKNNYSHPRPRYIQTLGNTDCHVVCSQLTQRCEMQRVRNGEHVFQGSGALGLRPSRSGVSCRGAWRVYLRDGQLMPDQFDAIHLERVSKLRRPQCLYGRGWRRGRELPAAVV
jgi:beta-lactamase superfamily II metal-dependent hydrolase